MENIRAFFNYVDDFKIEQFKAKEKLRKERGYSVLGNTDFEMSCKYVEKIANKLFSMCKEDREIYVKLIVSLIDNYHLICYDRIELITYEISDAFTNERIECKGNVYIETFNKDDFDISCVVNDIDFFIESLFCLFLDFGIDVHSIIDKSKEKAPLYNEYERMKEICEKAAESYIFSRSGKVRKKVALANTTQQVDVIRTFIKSAGVEYNNDTALAKFISWLCGGTEDSVRKNGIVPNTGYGNENELKKQFASIGIDYDKGTIKTLM